MQRLQRPLKNKKFKHMNFHFRIRLSQEDQAARAIPSATRANHLPQIGRGPGGGLNSFRESSKVLSDDKRKLKKTLPNRGSSACHGHVPCFNVFYCSTETSNCATMVDGLERLTGQDKCLENLRKSQVTCRASRLW